MREEMGGMEIAHAGRKLFFLIARCGRSLLEESCYEQLRSTWRMVSLALQRATKYTSTHTAFGRLSAKSEMSF